jgi:hypothetical protein
MKVACLVTFKNEEDIFPAWFRYLENQVDYFLFRDNESTDNSSNIVKNHPKTIFYETVTGTYQCNFYDKLIVEARKILSPDDWFMIWAPDLFPFFNVREIIEKAENLNKDYNCIKATYPNFFFTREMFEKWSNSKHYRKVIHSFNIDNYSYFANVGTSPSMIIKNVGDRVKYTHPKQEPPEIPNKKEYKEEILSVGHYRFRNPKQMIKRFQIRKQVNPNKNNKLSFVHYPTWDYRDYFIYEKYLHKLDGQIKVNQLSRTTLNELVSRSKS